VIDSSDPAEGKKKIKKGIKKKKGKLKINSEKIKLCVANIFLNFI
jgi:hypothetical protein